MHYGDDEAPVRSALCPLGLGYDAALGRPALARAALEAGNHVRCLSCAFLLPHGGLILRWIFAPCYAVVAAKATVSADDDGRFQPALTDVANDAGDFSNCAVGGIVGRETQLGQE